MAERFKAAVLKTVVDESLPRVRISIPPLCVLRIWYLKEGELAEWSKATVY